MGGGLSTCRTGQDDVASASQQNQRQDNLQPHGPPIDSINSRPSNSETQPGGIPLLTPRESVQASGPLQQQTTTEHQGRTEGKLLELLKKGVPVVAKAVQSLAPMLPSPGAQAAALLGSLLGMVERAIANHENLRELRRRAVAYLDLLAAYHPVLVRVQEYKSVVEEYREQLEGIVNYAKKYTSRNCIVKLFTGTSDKEHYEALCSSLADLSQRTTLCVQADNLAGMQDVQGKLNEVLHYLKSAANFFDVSAGIQRELGAVGGTKALIRHPGILRKVIGYMDGGENLHLEVVLPVLSAEEDPGPHRHIRQPDLRVFWQMSFTGKTDVSWGRFFAKFPSRLYGGGPSKSASRGPQGLQIQYSDVVRRLKVLLRSKKARKAFEVAVDINTDGRVSVYELNMAFGDDELPEQVQRLVEPPGSKFLDDEKASVEKDQQEGSRSSLVDDPQGESEALSDDDRQQHSEALSGDEEEQDDEVLSRERSSCASSESSFDDRQTGSETSSEDDDIGTYSVRLECSQLPQPDPGVVGREEEADGMLKFLEAGTTNLVLRAVGGMGKSTLAAQVGRLLQQEGGADYYGTIWVDLREAGSAAAVEARFCGAMGLQREEESNRNVDRILTKLDLYLRSQERERGAPLYVSLLVVVDNAEDALHQVQAADTLRTILKGLGVLDTVRLLVTSRVPLNLDSDLFEEREVGPISPQAAGRVIQATAQDLTSDEAEEVAGACGCVPLYLRLVAEALVAGRLTLQSVRSLSVQKLDPLRLILSSLKPSHRAAMTQLVVFPAVFHTEAAAAVLQTSLEQAQALLAVLYRSSLLLRGGRLGSGYVIHKAVLQAVLDAAGDEEKELIAAAEGRYGLHFLRLLGQWTGMYGSKEVGIALDMARDAQADIARLAELMAGHGSGCGLQKLLEAERLKVLEKDVHIRLTLSYDVVQFLEALGTVSAFEPGWEALRQAAERAGDRVRQANYLNLQARVAIMKGRNADGETKATRALKLLLEDAGGNKAVQLSTQPVLTAAALNSLGAARQSRKRLDEAENLLRQALALRRRACGEAAFSTISTMKNLASCLKAQGKVEEASQLYEKILGLCSWLHPTLALVKNSMANCVIESGRDYASARMLYESALHVLERFLGEEHQHTLATRINLARCLLAADQTEYAEMLVKPTVSLLQKMLGQEHPDTLSAKALLGQLAFARGAYAEAERLYRKALAPGRLTVEQDAIVRLRLAACVERNGRDVDARKLTKQVVEARSRLLGPDHPDTQEATLLLAEMLQGKASYGEAATLFGRVAELRQRQLGGEHEATLEAVRSQALCWLGVCRYPEAEAALRQVMRAQIVQKGMSHTSTVETIHKLVECLVLQGKYVTARQLQSLVEPPTLQNTFGKTAAVDDRKPFSVDRTKYSPHMG